MEKSSRSPWFWVPSLYFAEGIPYVIVMMVSVIMYKRMGVSNADIALYTSWLYLPWVIKPLWSPVVDILRTKRFWIITMQLVIGAGLGGVALTIPLPLFFKLTLGFLWLLAFSSATHDIAADGFYMLGLDQHQQTWFVGVRSTFYRIAMITGQGILIILAGFIENHSGLGKADIEVRASSAVQIRRFIHPDSLQNAPIEAGARMLVYPSELVVGNSARPKSEVDSLLRFAADWNRRHGFIIEEKTMAGQTDKPSWWEQSVKQPFVAFLTRYFGEERRAPVSDKVGNIGLLYIRLAEKPVDGPKAVHLGRVSGNKSIALVSGERLIFTETNWQSWALAVVQVDSRLSGAAVAQFTAQSGNIPLAWSITFLTLTGLFVLLFLYHRFILPRPAADRSAYRADSGGFFTEFFRVFVLFFKKDRIGVIIAFLLLYRFAEAQLVKMVSPFLLDAQEIGGLALTTEQVGVVYGTIGILFLTLGGLAGGFLAARHGLKAWLWPMAFIIHTPDSMFVFLSYAMPDNLWIIGAAVAVEQFGYGFGFTAYMLYMIYISEGEHKTAHFAIATGFMALGMMLPGMFSGMLQEIIGYKHFFVWVMISTLPGFAILPFIKVEKEFGKKKEA
jgi:PAT family beta-lactamase induction signal transducer AmpG